MGFNYLFTFYSAEDKNIGGDVLGRDKTHYPDNVREFWMDICYTTMTKKEFIEKFMKKIHETDIDSESYQKLAGAFGYIVSCDGWCETVTISINCD